MSADHLTVRSTWIPHDSELGISLKVSVWRDLLSLRGPVLQKNKLLCLEFHKPTYLLILIAIRVPLTQRHPTQRIASPLHHPQYTTIKAHPCLPGPLVLTRLPACQPSKKKGTPAQSTATVQSNSSTCQQAKSVLQSQQNDRQIFDCCRNTKYGERGMSDNYSG